MDTNAGVFKICKPSYIFTDRVEETIRNKIFFFFLDWSSVSTLNC